MTTISNGTTMIVPDLVLGFSAEAPAGTIQHELLDGTVSFSLTPDRPAAGELGLLFRSRSAAWAAYAALGIPAVWTLVDVDVPQVGMSFVRDGARRIELDDETRDNWIVTVGYKVKP